MREALLCTFWLEDVDPRNSSWRCGRCTRRPCILLTRNRTLHFTSRLNNEMAQWSTYFSGISPWKRSWIRPHTAAHTQLTKGGSGLRCKRGANPCGSSCLQLRCRPCSSTSTSGVRREFIDPTRFFSPKTFRENRTGYTCIRLVKFEKEGERERGGTV